MLENSILTDESIIKLVKDNYNISIKKIEHINRGSANIYKLVGDKEYILKEFPSDRTIESIEKEYSIIDHLAHKGLRVPEYIKTINNMCYIKYQDRIIIIQIYLDGYTMDNNTGDYNKVMESANLYGQLLVALSDYPNEVDNYNDWPSKDSILTGIDKIKALKQKINLDNPYHDQFIKDLDNKIEIAEQLLDLNFDDMKKVTQMISHGDYSVQQFIYNANDKTAIIDFETIKRMPIVWEITRSYNYVDLECKDGSFNIDTFIDYVKEVMKYVKLNQYDLQYMIYIYLCQLVCSTFGYKQYNNDYTKTSLLEFALFRTNVCRYLFNNKEIIIDRLKKVEN